MKNYLSANKNWWNNATKIHSRSKMYNLKEFKKGKTSLQSIELQELGNVKGKTLLHLMCHFGMDTLSWARKGAIVTGVDLSNDSITLAKQLGKEQNTQAEFICSDVYELPKVLQKKFDIVFMSYGVLLWLSDIKKWAQIVNTFLNKGGTLYLVDTHPFMNMFSHDFTLYYNYFDKGPHMDDSSGTYTDWNEKTQGTTYEWSYTISDVINALTDERLHIEYVHEFPFTTYNQFPGFMKKNAQGHHVLKNKNIQVPLLFSVKATKA